MVILEMTAEELGIDAIDTVELKEIPQVFLTHARSAVINAYAKVTGMTANEIENHFEGGIDSWIGFGSVACYELEGSTMVGYGYGTIKMAIT
jgi:hypothetical protein